MLPLLKEGVPTSPIKQTIMRQDKIRLTAALSTPFCPDSDHDFGPDLVMTLDLVRTCAFTTVKSRKKLTFDLSKVSVSPGRYFCLSALFHGYFLVLTPNSESFQYGNWSTK